MFINNKTDQPAWLVSHDGDVTYSLAADLAHPHHTVPSYQFFAGHREATRDEIDAHTPRAKSAAEPKPAPRKAPKGPARKTSARKAPASDSSPQV